MRKLSLIVIALILLAGLAGCATFRGMGEDIQNIGKGIKKSTS
ncbi:MAG: entericidin [candidate division NC10 bacterium RBG_16_65_8]|jgi:predicted small secreted protein|nr:MAG: entericidin [candidate division NC10 bacterium RBG_16_65_8]